MPQAVHLLTKSAINKPAMNYRTILIAAVFRFVHQVEKDSLRWLDTVFQGHKLRCHKQSFGKLPPQLYQIKMKLCYDQGCNDIGVAIATK